MSKLVFDDKSGKISDVKFAYAKINRPSKKYQSEETEYSVNVVVDKATAKEMKKNFPKNSVKEIDTTEFEDKFKFAPPYPEQDEQYILTFKTNTHQKDGKEKPYEWSTRPKVYVPDADGRVKDITRETRVANGSGGVVAFNISNGAFGQIHHLSGILIKDLIELPELRPQTPFGEPVENPYEDMAEEYMQETEDVGF